jgi:hypothetical protein
MALLIVPISLGWSAGPASAGIAHGLERSAIAHRMAGSADTTWRRDTWDRTAWEGRSVFARMALLRGLLDGGCSLSECNHVAWRALGFRLSPDGSGLVPPGDDDTADMPSLPDVMGETTTLARLEAQLPLDDDDEMECLETLVCTLHGEELTRLLVKEANADFLARRTLVRWLFTTQTSLDFR